MVSIPPASSTMTVDPTRNSDSTLNRQHALAYNEMTMGQSGSVMNREQKKTLRDKHGLCKECVGLPVQLYDIRKNTLFPLWQKKIPRDVKDECREGICLVCHPTKNKKKVRRHTDMGALRGNISNIMNNSIGGSSGDQATRQRTISAELSSRSPVFTPAVPPVNLSPSPTSPMGLDGARVTPLGPNSSSSLPTLPPLASPTDTRKSIFGGVSDDDSSSELPPDQENNSGSDNLESMYDRMRQEAAPPLIRETPSPDESDSSPTTQPSPPSTFRRPSVHEDDVAPPPVPKSAPSRDTSTHEQTSAESLPSDHSTGNASPPSFGSHPLSPQESPSSPHATAPEENAPMPSLESEQVRNVIAGLESLIQDMVAADGGSELVAHVILGAMNENISQEQIQTYCLRAIWDLCKDDEKQKQYVMQAGATETIMRALCNFSDSVLVQEKGCGAIWSLGVNSHNRVVLVRAGACERVVAAMKQFYHKETLVRTAIGALRTLSPEMEAQDAFKSLKASELAAKSMMLHRSSVSIQRDGCAFLSNCAVNMEKQFVSVVSLEELDAVVQAMANHKEEVSVMQAACFALKNYVFENKNCRTLRLCEGLDELLAHASVFDASPSCPQAAVEIMQRMQLSGAADESIEDQALIKLSAIVESQGNSPEPVFEFMRSYDWSPRLISAGLHCLRRMCSGEDAQHTRIVEILPRIIRLAQKSERAAGTVDEACELVATLSESHDNHSAIIEAGACDFVVDALTRHVNDERVVKAAMSALNPLSSNFECWCDAERGKRVQLVTYAIGAHATCEMVKVNGAAVMVNLEALMP